MKRVSSPEYIAPEKLPAYLDRHAIHWQKKDKLKLGFGHGNDGYRLWSYPGPADDETMGIFFEWHTEDYFDVDTSPHIAIGLRGPVPDDPHRGRGLAIGILSSHMPDPQNEGQLVELFMGCPAYPGGPSCFIEDFTINEGIAPACEWQFSAGKSLPELLGGRRYRIDVLVSSGQVWANIWMLSNSHGDAPKPIFLGQASCTEDVPAFSGNPEMPCPEDPDDRGVGNAFIGTGFSDPETRSWIDQIYMAHWKNN